MTCEQLQQQVESLESERDFLQDSLQKAGTAQKAAIVAAINRLNERIQQVQILLERCVNAVC